MGANSKIEWTDHTWNPWIGCTEVSPGCANCYAKDTDKRYRFTSEGWGARKPRHRTSEDYWRKPIAWNEAAKNKKVKPKVFCASLGDWLDSEVPLTWLAEMLALIGKTPNLNWLLLTKRPQNFFSRFEKILSSGIEDELTAVPHQWRYQGIPENVWIGASVEDQKRANERIPELLQIPARVRWLSCEPLLGPLNLERILDSHGIVYDVLSGMEKNQLGYFPCHKIDWVIAGGESGPKARAPHPDWFRSLRDQCAENGTAYFFKQWGEYSPEDAPRETKSKSPNVHVWPDGTGLRRFGKKSAGYRLDGEIIQQFPEVTR